MQMMYGLVLGVIVGTMVSSEFGATYLQPLGQLFIRLIRMVVVPLVVATLIAGSASLGDASKIGKIAVKTILFFAITTAIAVTIGLIVANFMEPGTGLTISVEGLKAKAAAAPPLSKVLLEIVPINPIEAFAKGNMLQVIFFSIFFGFCLLAYGRFRTHGDRLLPESRRRHDSDDQLCHALRSDRCVWLDRLHGYTSWVGCSASAGQAHSYRFHRNAYLRLHYLSADHQTYRHEDFRLPQRRFRTLAYRFHNLLFCRSLGCQP